jgi:plastocyanin
MLKWAGRSRRLFFVLALVTVAVTLAALACGGNGDETASGGDPVTFDIALGDEVRDTDELVSFFTPNEFTVAAGQEVTFNLSNDGTVPHNMRIAGPDGEYMTDDDTLVDPDVLNPGDTAVLEWAAPSQPGTIIFRCDFHPESVGTITVQ